MGAKAKLTVVLKANETVVAEIENDGLWQRILGIINRAGEVSDDVKDIGRTDDLGDEGDDIDDAPQVKTGAKGSVAKFAKSLGIRKEEVEGALGPTGEPPFLHLNSHNWEAMKKGTPARGPGAIPPIAIAATLLALWAKETGVDTPITQNLAIGVLKAINVIEKNPSRGIKNTKWLLPRAGGVIAINPAEIGKAISIAKSFCSKVWNGGDSV